MLISSPANATVKGIRALRARKERTASGTFFAEGIRLVGEALETGAPIELLVVTPELLISPYGQSVVDSARRATIPVLEVTAAVFESISARQGPQGLGAVVRQRWQEMEALAPADELCWVALAGGQDPGNVGTILRTSDAVGGAGLILVGDTTDPHDPTAVRASMGTLFSQRLARASTPDLARWKRQHNLSIVGASDHGATDYQQHRYQQPLLVFMGSERAGLDPHQLNLCDALVRIPMLGRADSLNVAVATAVILYEVLSQARRSAPAPPP